MDQTDAAGTKTPEVVHPYIERNPEVLGGEPVVRGTRISVRHIVQWDRMGHGVDEIVSLYPHLTHAQVHDALSFYFDHRTEIDHLIEENSDASVRSKYQTRPWMK